MTFSGSATTAHAVMKLNAEDGSNRKYIMVQLPEEIEVKSKTNKADYKNICEIGKERIRRAGKKLKKKMQTRNVLISSIQVFVSLNLIVVICRTSIIPRPNTIKTTSLQRPRVSSPTVQVKTCSSK